MQAYNADGRPVSLLNDDDIPEFFRNQLRYKGTYAPSLYRQPSSRSVSSSPHTPGLLRSDSYDSQMSNEPASPLTPGYDYGRGYGAGPVISDAESWGQPTLHGGAKRPVSFGDVRSVSSYEDDASSSTGGEKPGRRYPCRFRDTHGCEKTFTTSGHASRHSKIHTAEKGVPCSFPGCSKKFTRADNMKQHLDTHYKDKTRSSPSSRTSADSSEARTSVSGRPPTKTKLAPVPSNDPWGRRSHTSPNSPGIVRTPSGLDTLARIACQEHL